MGYRSRLAVGFTLSVTVTAAVLATDQPCVGLLIQADPDNSVDIFIGGDATTLPIQLAAGSSFSCTVENANVLYAKTASSTATLNCLAFR